MTTDRASVIRLHYARNALFVLVTDSFGSSAIDREYDACLEEYTHTCVCALCR